MRFLRFLPIALVSAVGLSSSGCVENRTTLFISGIASIDAGGGECTVDIPTDTFIAQGVYDPTIAQEVTGIGYTAYIEVGNQLVPRGDNNTLKPETSRIQLEGAVIEMSSPNGGSSVPAFTKRFSGLVNPVAGSEPGYASIPVELIPASLDLADATYLVSIKIFGHTLGGKEVESGEFVFPINVVNGGLTRCSANLDADALITDPCGRLGQDRFPLYCSANGTGVCAGVCQ